MTTWTVIFYCRPWRGTGWSRTWGVFWCGSVRGRRWSHNKTATIDPNSGKLVVPPRGNWYRRHSLMCQFKALYVTGFQLQWRMTRSSTTGWDMQWVGDWGFSTWNMVSLGHRTRSGFRGASTSLLALSAGLAWWLMAPSQKQWRVSRGKSGRECMRRICPKITGKGATYQGRLWCHLMCLHYRVEFTT